MARCALYGISNTDEMLGGIPTVNFAVRRRLTCEFSQPIDHQRIVDALTAFQRYDRNLFTRSTVMGKELLPVYFAQSFSAVVRASQKSALTWSAWNASSNGISRRREIMGAWDITPAAASWRYWSRLPAPKPDNTRFNGTVVSESWDCTFYLHLANPETRDHPAFCMLEAVEAGAWLFFITHEEILVVTRPNVSLRDNRLHDESGPAFQVLDIEDYFWKGVNVPKEVVLNPEIITVPLINGERNAEFRRILMERYGEGRYMIDSGLLPTQKDEYGTLYRQSFPNDEALCMVHVTNSTPEPDGSFVSYWLPVPPNTLTAHQGVAWSFYMKAEDYRPRFES